MLNKGEGGGGGMLTLAEKRRKGRVGPSFLADIPGVIALLEEVMFPAALSPDKCRAR